MTTATNLWKVWRCHLRLALWDDIVLSGILLLVPIVVGVALWYSLMAPLPLHSNPNVKAIEDIPVSVQLDVKRGCVVYRRLGPRD